MADKFPNLDWRRGRPTSLLMEEGFAADLMVSEFFAPPPAGSGLIKVWNGSAWVEKPVKVWNGSAWVTKPVKFWTGSAWEAA